MYELLNYEKCKKLEYAYSEYNKLNRTDIISNQTKN